MFSLNNFKFPSSNEELKASLERNLLLGVKIDYLTLNFEHDHLVEEFLNQLKTLKPDLTVSDQRLNSKIAQTDPDTVEIDEITGKNFVKTTTKTRTDVVILRVNTPVKLEETPNLVKQEGKTENSDTSIKKNNGKIVNSVRIPGSFSQQVVMSLFNGSIYLNPNHFTISRIDLKLCLSAFSYNEISQDRAELKNLYGALYIQNQQLKDCAIKLCLVDQPHLSDNFYMLTMFPRKSRRYARFYVKEQTKDLSFELEFKRESSRRYFECIVNKDMFEFNKTAVLEFMFFFKYLIKNPFTKSLHDYNENYLKLVKQKLFSGENYYKRQPFSDGNLNVESSSLVPAPKFNQLLKKKNYVFHSNVFSSIQSSFSKENSFMKGARSMLILTFCSQHLINKLTDHYGNSVVKGLLTDNRFLLSTFLSKDFKLCEEFKIQFDLNELISFLGLTPNSYSRKTVLNLLNELQSKAVTIHVDSGYTRETLIYCYQYRNSKGQKPRLTLQVNPLILFDIYNKSFIFKKDVLESYFDIVRKITKSKTNLPVYTEPFFVYFFQGLGTNDGSFMTKIIQLRDQKHKNKWEHQAEIVYELKNLGESLYDVELGVIMRGSKIIPIPKEVFFSFFNYQNLKNLKEPSFFFTKKNLLENYDKFPENYDKFPE